MVVQETAPPSSTGTVGARTDGRCAMVAALSALDAALAWLGYVFFGIGDDFALGRRASIAPFAARKEPCRARLDASGGGGADMLDLKAKFAAELTHVEGGGD